MKFAFYMWILCLLILKFHLLDNWAYSCDGTKVQFFFSPYMLWLVVRVILLYILRSIQLKYFYWILHDYWSFCNIFLQQRIEKFQCLDVTEIVYNIEVHVYWLSESVWFIWSTFLCFFIICSFVWTFNTDCIVQLIFIFK